MVIENNTKLLNMMLKDQLNQEELYQPGPYWKGYVTRITKAIYVDGLHNFRANSRIGKGFADTIVINPFDLLSLDSWKSKIYKKIVQIPLFKRYFLLHTLNILNGIQAKLKNIKIFIWQMVFTVLKTVFFTCNNYELGRSYLVSFLRVHNYSKVVDFSKVETVFEIGGGFGALCHTLLHLFSNIKKYLYLDIPPILYIATQYLKLFLW